jgi:hypothetical protein
MHRTHTHPIQSAWIVVIALAALSVSCTAGHVTKNGSPVAGAEIRIWTCDALNDFQTVTDAGGNFKFNPFDPDSPAFDSSEFVPPGPIAIMVTGAAGSTVARRNHQYDSQCPTPYNGSTQSQPCKVYSIDLVPMSLPEFLAEANAFLGEDCGLESEMARRLSGAAIGSGRQPIGDLSARPSAAGCIHGCSQSCAGQSIDDFTACMCICVESQCRVSFGPFCTETAE